MKLGHNYFVYLITNVRRRPLYTGVTNDLYRRMMEHLDDIRNQRNTFVAKYRCSILVYYEHFQFVQDAIAREKEIKGWTRSKKDELINSFNPSWKCLLATVD